MERLPRKSSAKLLRRLFSYIRNPFKWVVVNPNFLIDELDGNVEEGLIGQSKAAEFSSSKESSKIGENVVGQDHGRIFSKTTIEYKSAQSIPLATASNRLSRFHLPPFENQQSQWTIFIIS